MINKFTLAIKTYFRHSSIFIRSSTRKRLARIFHIFLAFTLIFSWYFTALPEIFNFPPEVQELNATTYGTFTFDADDDADEDAWTFVSDQGPSGSPVNGLNPANTSRAWSHDTNDTTSSGVGPTSGQGGSPDGYAYTEGSSSGNPPAAGETWHMTFNTTLDASAESWVITFYTNQRGNDNNTTVVVQTNENGAGWVSRGSTFGGSGDPDKVATNGTQIWTLRTVDLDGLISDASTQIRLLLTYPSSGLGWHNDYGIDTVTITGTSLNQAPAAPTLHDIPFDNEKTGDSTPDFEFTGSDPDGAASIIYQIQIDDDSAFGSPLVNCESDTSCAAGGGSFTNTVSGGDTSPFNEGERMRFTPTTAMTTGTTYYWRVRAEDDSGSGGSGSYGSYTTTRSVTFISGTSPSEWFQTTDEQFDTGTLSNTQTSGSDSVQIPSGGAITRLDAAASVAASTLNYSVSAGSNRALVACFGWEFDGQTSVTGVTYGGQTMTQAFQQDTPDAGFSAGTACFYILDAGIQAASGTTITPTYSTTPADEVIHAASYAGVDQTGGATTVPETATAESNEATPNPFTTIDITEASGNLVIAIVGDGNASTVTWQSDMAEQTDQADASSNSSFADRLSTTNTNVTVEGTIASQNRAAGGSAEFAAASVSSGTIMSPEIDFDWVTGQSSWGTAAFSTTETNGDVKLRVYYTASTACDTIVPDAALSGNSSGFDVSASPIDISGLNTTTYNRICLRATLTDSGGTPFLNDWTVTWATAAAGPTNTQLMRHGKWFDGSGEQPFTF